MQISEWAALLILLKWASYVAIAALAGTLVVRLLCDSKQLAAANYSRLFAYLKRWQMYIVALGLGASVIQIPIEAGAIAESGFSGMLDPFMLDIVWQSVIGEQAIYRMLAFTLALFGILIWRPAKQSTRSLSVGITLITLGFIAYSFTFTGHSAQQNIWIKSILALHLLAISTWVGSLWPLYKSCKLLPVPALKSLMHRYGQMAVIVIVVLLGSGSFLVFHFINSLAELFTSNYGQLILLKLLLVSMMLLLGAWHKLVLVPQITQQQQVDTLTRSISVEMLVALLVLITTSVLTTFVGPPG